MALQRSSARNLPSLLWTVCKICRDSVRDLLFPPRCAACGKSLQTAQLDGSAGLCPDCFQEIMPIGSPMCIRCGRPFVGPAGTDHICGQCIEAPPPYDKARSLFRYQGPVRLLIHRVKYHDDGYALKTLVQLSSRFLPGWTSSVDVILPVPLHPGRLRTRGFNQSVRLASSLFPDICLEPFLLRRVVNTRPQTGLGLKERASNIRGAFTVKGHPVPQKILLIDDIYTTGATVSECAKILKRAGVLEVNVLTIARA